jgi:hypothetical protein
MTKAATMKATVVLRELGGMWKPLTLTVIWT